MNRKFFHKLFIAVLVGLMMAEPVISYAQTDISLNSLTALSAIATDLDGQIIMSQKEKKLWDESISGQNLSERDKRLTNYILPALAKEFGQIHVDILKDHATTDTNQSRLLANSEGVSQRFFAKAASITSLGTITCADSSTIFMREIDPQKTLWLNQQNGSPNQDRFFGRSFDTTARQSLLLPIRSFTNRMTTAQTWSGMLQQIAKGEIEERFDLQPGVLANTPIGDLDTAIARARVVRQLGLAQLPDFTTISSFYALIGQSQVEQALNLPTNSFVSRNDTRFWYETYQNIGLRVLEEELDLPDTNTATSPFPATAGLLEIPRFQLLAKRLETRGQSYQNPVLSLGLPTQGYLPTASSESDVYNRLKNGDPDAFAAVGAYFLADSLQLSAAAIAELVQSVLRGENRAVNLATAHPLDSNLRAEQLLSGEMTTNQREQLLRQIGEQQKTAISTQLNRVNGNVLLALTGGSQTPTIGQIESLFLNQSGFGQVIATLKDKSLDDADYPDGFSAATLQRRGEQILGEALDIDPTDLQRLSDPNESAITTSIADRIDSQLDWPSIGDKPFSRLFATGQLTDRQLLETGIDHLWRQFAFSSSLQSALNRLYFDNSVQAVSETTTADPTPVQTPVPAPTSTPSQVDDKLETTDEEVVVFAILGEAPSIGDALKAATGIDAENLVPILSGRFNSGLKIVTLSQIAKVLGDGSTITTPKLLNLYDRPNSGSAEPIAKQGDAVFDNGFVAPSFFDSLLESEPWKALDDEIVRNWNIDCPNHQSAAQEAVNSLVAFMLTWPETTNDPALVATRPVQIFTFDRDTIADDVRTLVTEKYPTQADSKAGLFSNPRDWDDIYIGL